MKNKLNLLLDSADEYVANSSWKDMGLLKICVMALGIAIGSCFSATWRKYVRPLTLLLFLLTLIPLLIKFIPILVKYLSQTENTTLL